MHKTTQVSKALNNYGQQTNNNGKLLKAIHKINIRLFKADYIILI
jgi:hypothetical protein